MAYVREKWIPGEDGKQYGPYFYLVQSVRKGNKVTQKHIKYLGKHSSAMAATAYAVQEYGPEMMDAQSDAPLGTTRAIFSENVVPKKKPTKKKASDPMKRFQELERQYKRHMEEHHKQRAARVEAAGGWKAVREEWAEIGPSWDDGVMERKNELNEVLYGDTPAERKAKKVQQKGLHFYDTLSKQQQEDLRYSAPEFVRDAIRARERHEKLQSMSNLF